MDIAYLLFLQDLRESAHNLPTPFMEWISLFAVIWLPLIPIFIYWCVDKKKGLYLLASLVVCRACNALLKLTACVYRPWIRDGRVLPAGDSIRTATGYSYPSGHTTTAGPLAGGMAVNLWDKKKTRWLSVILVFFVLLTGFSRNYLGVHTPQDVFVAITLSVLCLVVTAVLFEYLEQHPEKEDWFLLAGFIICWAGILFISVKNYPMDYDAEDKLIVDPQKMMNDGYGDIGKVIGFIIARYVEKKWIRFRPLKNGWVSIVICLLGLVPMVLAKDFLRPAMTAWLGSHWGKLSFSVIHAFYYIALFPLFLKLIGRRIGRSKTRVS
jgi:membrane-associated phospholipid phosphatase